MKAATPSFTCTCDCGATMLSASGKPICVATCHCDDCIAAARGFEAASGRPVIGADGGVDYVLFRKDRLALLRGGANLADHRLTAGTPTRRVLATCCNAPMLVDFAPGHWVSVFRSRIAEPVSLPNIRTYTPRFFLKLIGAWVAMGFRRPKLPF